MWFAEIGGNGDTVLAEKKNYQRVCVDTRRGYSCPRQMYVFIDVVQEHTSPLPRAVARVCNISQRGEGRCRKR